MNCTKMAHSKGTSLCVLVQKAQNETEGVKEKAPF